MDTITPLLTNSLAVLLLPILLGVRALRKKFATSSALPTIHEAIITFVLLGIAVALSFAGYKVTPAAPTELAQLWWVQGLLFWIGLLITDAGMDATSIQTPDARRAIEAAKVLVAGAFAGALLLGAAPVRADGLPWISFDRLAGGVTVQGTVYSNRGEALEASSLAAFSPKAYLDYSFLDEISGHVSYQFGVGEVQVNELHAGGSVRLLREDPVRVSAAVDAVKYSGSDASIFKTRDVTEYSLRFSKVLKRSKGAPRLGIQFQPAWVPANESFVYRLGLNAPLFGGNPLPETEGGDSQ